MYSYSIVYIVALLKAYDYSVALVTGIICTIINRMMTFPTELCPNHVSWILLCSTPSTAPTDTQQVLNTHVLNEQVFNHANGLFYLTSTIC